MKWYRNQKIKSKLILGFLVLSILAAIVGGFGVLTIVRIKASADDIFRVNVTALQHAGVAAMKTQSVISSAQALSKMDYATEKDAIEVNGARIVQDMAQVDGILENLGGIVTGDLKSKTFEEITASWDTLKTYLNSVIEKMKVQNGASMAESAIRLSTNVATRLTSEYTVLIEQVSQEADDRAADNNSQATVAMLIMGSVLVAGIVLSIVLGLAIARGIGNPLKVITAAGMRIAEGDVHVDDILTEKDKVLASRKDEIGTLATMVNSLISGAERQAQEAQLVAQGDLTVEFDLKSDRDLLGLSMRELVDNFHNVAVSIVGAAERVALSSDTVSNSSIVLSQGATEQASAVEQLNETVGGISRQTELNAGNAAKANALAQKARENAEAGNRQMQEMLTAMQEISDASRSINKVVKVIDDIAFQTNILALNAAVEAARAGQAGRGFAVVAEEVRALAGRSANAVQETTQMLEGSIRKVTAGTKIANDTAGALSEILTQVEKAAELVGAINISSEEQAQGIRQVELGLGQVSTVVQTNAATAEESAAASEELSRQAAQLREYVEVFKLRDGVASGTAVKAGSAAGKPDLLPPARSAAEAPATPVGGYGKY